MDFELEQVRAGGAALLRVRGELDIATASQLAQAVTVSMEAMPEALLIDLTHTTFLDSTGAREIARAAQRGASTGLPVRVICPADNRPVRRVFDLLQMAAAVEIVEPGGEGGEPAF